MRNCEFCSKHYLGSSMVVVVLILLLVAVPDTSDTVSPFSQYCHRFLATIDTYMQGFSFWPFQCEVDVVHLATVFFQVLELQLYFSTRDIHLM